MRLRHQLLEGELLELVAHVLHAHAAGERGVDVQGLLGDPPALVGGHEMQGAHIVEAVGELDQQHAHVLGDGEEKLAQVFRLRRPHRDEVEALQLGEALDQGRDLMPEELVDLLARRRRILDGVVEHRGDDRRNRRDAGR